MSIGVIAGSVLFFFSKKYLLNVINHPFLYPSDAIYAFIMQILRYNITYLSLLWYIDLFIPKMYFSDYFVMCISNNIVNYYEFNEIFSYYIVIILFRSIICVNSLLNTHFYLYIDWVKVQIKKIRKWTNKKKYIDI